MAALHIPMTWVRHSDTCLSVTLTTATLLNLGSRVERWFQKQLRTISQDGWGSRDWEGSSIQVKILGKKQKEIQDSVLLAWVRRNLRVSFHARPQHVCRYKWLSEKWNKKLKQVCGERKQTSSKIIKKLSTYLVRSRGKEGRSRSNASFTVTFLPRIDW